MSRLKPVPLSIILFLPLLATPAAGDGVKNENSQDAVAVAELVRALGDKDLEVRTRAARALGEMGEKAASAELRLWQLVAFGLARTD